MMKPLLALLFLFLAFEGFSEGQISWKPGTLLQSEYKELAGTLILGASTPPMVRSEGREYLLMLTVQETEIPQFTNKTAVIMKGIAGTVALPGQPVQHLFWPMECTIRAKRFVFPDPTALHWQWLTGLQGLEQN